MITNVDMRTETRLSSIESGIKEIRDQLEKITKKLTKAEAREKEQLDKIINIENICSECTAMKLELEEVRIKNVELTGKVKVLEEKMQWQERKQIRNNIEIFGVPKRDNEQINKIVIGLAQSAKVTLNENDIEDSYRVTGKDGTGKQLVVKLKDLQKKNEILKAMKLKKPRLKDIKEQPENKIIFVNEMITREAKKIFYHTKIEARNRSWFKTWIYAGTVHLLMEEKGRQIKIENEEQLVTLLK